MKYIILLLLLSCGHHVPKQLDNNDLVQITSSTAFHKKYNCSLKGRITGIKTVYGILKETIFWKIRFNRCEKEFWYNQDLIEKVRK